MSYAVGTFDSPEQSMGLRLNVQVLYPAMTRMPSVMGQIWLDLITIHNVANLRELPQFEALTNDMP